MFPEIVEIRTFEIPTVDNLSTVGKKILDGIVRMKNGEEGTYDCRDLLNFGVFKELQDENYFKNVAALHGTVAWPHDQDICPDTLYLDSQKIK